MLSKLALIFKDPDLRRKILFILFFLGVFRLAAAIPVPGMDASRFAEFFAQNQFLGLLNIFSGGALDNLSIVMLGVGPFITASIIMQLLTMIFPNLKEMYQEEGEAGKQKFNQYSRLLTLPLAFLQGFGLLTILERQGILELALSDKIINVIIVAAGSIFLMWIGELISEYGIGNGVSLMIFAGIVASFPITVQQTVFSYDPSQLPTIITFIAIALITVAGVVTITEGERPIPVHYAKRVRGMRMYGGTATYLPIRVNQAGVIPIIFALSILLFPQMIAGFFASSSVGFLRVLSSFVLDFLANTWLYGAFYFVLVVLFTYFYTAVTFDPQAISNNLQKAGAFVPGVRPGPSTAAYLGHIVTRTTLVGALFLGAVAVLPIAVTAVSGLATLTIGGTALLIVVSVALETWKQIEAQLSLRTYS